MTAMMLYAHVSKHINQSCLYTYYSQYATRKLPQYLHVHTYMYT